MILEYGLMIVTDRIDSQIHGDRPGEAQNRRPGDQGTPKFRSGPWRWRDGLENHHQIMGKSSLNHGYIIGKSCVNHR